jgi:hypothetical protein
MKATNRTSVCAGESLWNCGPRRGGAKMEPTAPLKQHLIVLAITHYTKSFFTFTFCMCAVKGCAQYIGKYGKEACVRVREREKIVCIVFCW